MPYPKAGCWKSFWPVRASPQKLCGCVKLTHTFLPDLMAADADPIKAATALHSGSASGDIQRVARRSKQPEEWSISFNNCGI
jgi:hypothetical protein